MAATEQEMRQKALDAATAVFARLEEDATYEQADKETIKVAADLYKAVTGDSETIRANKAAEKQGWVRTVVSTAGGILGTVLSACVTKSIVDRELGDNGKPFLSLTQKTVASDALKQRSFLDRMFK